MSDKISDSLIDEILDDLKAKNLNDDSEEIYSIDDIDSLLAEIGGTDLAMGSYSSAYTSVPSTEKAEAVKTKRAESAFSIIIEINSRKMYIGIEVATPINTLKGSNYFNSHLSYFFYFPVWGFNMSQLTNTVYYQRIATIRE